MTKKFKITFMPGAFDNFEGSQEDLNELIRSLEQGLESGELLENSRPVDLEELLDEDPELAEQLTKMLDHTDRNRKLN